MSWSFDPTTREFVSSTITAQLTPMEAAAFTYLASRAGTVVSKEELATAVWGMAEGVQSETVPVTIRTMRKKLGAECLISTIRGSGYRMAEAPGVTNLPRLDQPYFERLTAESQVEELLAESWRVVTVTGAAGMGKSRLVAQVAGRLPSSGVYVSLAGVQNEQEAIRAVLLATGMVGGLAGVARALRRTPYLFVLDEVEGVLPAVHTMIDALPEHRFLVTSRIDLGRADEAVYALPGLLPDEARRFAARCLRASRWPGVPEPSLLSRFLVLVEGSPLAIEVATSTPFGVATLVDALTRGSALHAPVWTTAIDRSIAQLTQPRVETLLALCAARDGLPHASFVAWRGSAAEDHVLHLARVSLVTPVDDGWRLSAPLRAYLQEQHPDALDDARRSFRAWIQAAFVEAADEVVREPQRVLARMRPHLEDLLAVLIDTPVTELPHLLYTLLLLSYLGGPFDFYDAGWRTALRRMPGAPELTLLGAFIGSQASSEQLTTALNQVSDRFRVRTLFLLAHHWLPSALRPERHAVSKPMSHPELEALRQVVAVRATDEPEQEARTLLEVHRDRNLLCLLLRLFIAQSMQRRHAHNEAQPILAGLVTEFEAAGMVGMTITSLYALASSRGANGMRTECAETYIEAGQAALHSGLDGWAVSRAGLWLLLLGRTEAAMPYLDVGCDDTNQGLNGLFQTLKRVAMLRDGLPPPDPEIASTHATLTMVDGTSLATLVSDMWQVEQHIHRGRVAEARHLIGRATERQDTSAVRFWAHEVRTRLG